MNPTPNGPHAARPTAHAITNATVFVRPGEVLENATVRFEDGRITSVRVDGDADGAQVHDGTGLYVYAAFVDAFVEVDAPKPDADAPGTHWNSMTTPERHVLHGEGAGEKLRESLRSQGFATAGLAPKGGVVRGRGAVMGLGEPAGRASEQVSAVYRADGVHVLGFDTGSWRAGTYPTSVIGAVALQRQALIDAAWQADMREAGETMPANSLDALADDALIFFDCEQAGMAVLAHRTLEEAGRLGVLVGSGRELERLDSVVNTGRPIVLPVVYPDAPDVFTPGAADAVELRELMMWEQAATTARRLHAEGASVALTTHRLESRKDFLKNVRMAVREGLEEREALRMLTTTPADLLGVGDQVGTIEKGRRANLLVSDRPIFADGASVLDVWVDGHRHEVKAVADRGFDGVWDLAAGPNMYRMTVDGKRVSVALAGDGAEGDNAEDADKGEKARKVVIDQGSIAFVVDVPAAGEDGDAASFVVAGSRSSADGEDVIIGQGRFADERTFQWSATRADAEMELADLAGTWHARLAGRFTLGLAVDKEGVVTVFDTNAEGEPVEVEARDVSLEGDRLSFIFDHGPFGWGGDFPMRARVMGDRLVGDGNRSDGQPFSWVAWKGKKADEFEPAREELGMPFGPYAGAIPEQGAVIVRGATIWTSGDQGVIEDGVLFCEDGVISWVGRSDQKINLRVPSDAIEIDGEGLHVTPGIIDAHSHSGLFRFGVNEGGDQITSEVRIGDALDPTHISWYRQLVSGVTTVNSLHGSANPIGGQNAIHKVRWGSTDPDQMRMEGAKLGIKFALGENVTQKNWNSDGTRYPQTRMGVEAIIRDRFLAAQDYAKGRTAAERSGTPFRRDLELEPIAEILAGDRLIHCHSYRQDEILMLCDIARAFGFTIGAFQHVLEGYKVAEHIREASLGGSAFSDWWAFKVEVQDAIPQNGPIMHEAGVTVSFNSDSDDLVRRMNTEAAKAVRYGGTMDEAEALKFVTINPAIQLAIDDRVGSLEKGKDADFAIWNGHPLSTTTKCVATFVDGRAYYTEERDLAMREANRTQRARLIQKILAEGRPDSMMASAGDSAAEPDMVGEQPGGDDAGPAHHAHHDHDHHGHDGHGHETGELLDHEITHLMEHLIEEVARGIDPTFATCGVCGVGGIHTLGGH